MKICFTWCLMVCISVSFAQSKKEIQKYKIKSLTESFQSVNGDGTLVLDMQERYDKNGNVVEKIVYDKTGQLKQRTVLKYNNLFDKIEETVFDSMGKQIGRETYKYDSFGEKSEEAKYNSNDELISKSVYSFNKKQLKTARKTFDAKGNLIQIKIYTYEF